MTAAATAEPMLQQGMAMHRAGRFGDAESAYLAVLKADPGNAQALNLIGALYLTGEKPRDAAKWLSRRLKKAPDDTLARLNLGKAWLAADEALKAVKTLEPLVSANPANIDAAICLSRAEQRRGESAKADAVLKRLVSDHPASVEALTERANLLLLHKKPEQALTIFRDIVSLAPADLPARCNLAATLQSMYRLDEAEQVLSDAAAIDPSDSRLRFLATMNMALGGQFAEAAAAMEKLVAERPEDAAAQANLADILSYDNRTPEAVERLEGLIRSGIDDADIWHNYGVMLLQVGRMADAEQAHRKSLALNPRNGNGWRHLAELKKFTDGDRDLRQMLDLDRDPGLDGENRMQLGFALGKAFADIGKHDRAFSHLEAANRARRADFDFDIAAHEAWVDAIIAAFPDPLPEPGPAEPGTIFIVGMPRSGTTLAEQILASHPDVAAGGELMELRKAQETHWPDYPAAPSGDKSTAIASAYIEGTARFRSPTGWLTDKLPENALRCGLIAMAFPSARIVHCLRDPLDVSLSCYQRLFSGLQPFAYDLEELGRYHAAHNRLMAHWRKVLPGRFMDFDYERVIADQEGESRRLLAHAGLDWHEDCLQFHRTGRSVRTASAAQVRKPIYKSSLQRWKPYEKHLAPLIRALGGDG
jgi:predicted Zn-dependent protease